MGKENFVCIALIAVSFLLSVYFYNDLPDKIASHWNIKNEVDGYINKIPGLFFIPTLTGIIYIFFLILPKIDPLKNNIKSFEKYYKGFILVLIIFLLYIQILMIKANIDSNFNLGKFIFPGLSVILFFSGLLSEKSKRNWFIGIKTPWSLQNDKSWEKTNKLGSKMLKITSILILYGLISPEIGFFILIISSCVIISVTTVYSYLIYKKSES